MAPMSCCHPPLSTALRREVLAGLIGAAALPAHAVAPPTFTASAVHWPGPGGRSIHGYVAIPQPPRFPQPQILVLGLHAGLPWTPDADARALVDRIATAGLLAWTADNVANLPDLRASLAWLRTNRYATGRVALVALGPDDDLAQRIARAEGAMLAAIVLLGGAASASTVPTLALARAPDDTSFPAAATAFLKEHLA